MSELKIVPISFREACGFIRERHRHHKPPRGMKVAIGCLNDTLRGVAVIGRPIARGEDDGLCAEVTRTCTDGTPNANSMLYAACRKIARAMGYQRLITYTEDGESGSSLRAAGWILEAEIDPRKNWHDSSVKLQQVDLGLFSIPFRDPDGRGQVKRYRWRAW